MTSVTSSDMAKTKPFVRVDRGIAWVLGALLGAMALPLLIGPLLPEAEGAVRDGWVVSHGGLRKRETLAS